MSDISYGASPAPKIDDIESALNREVDTVMNRPPYKEPESPYSKANDAEIVGRIDRACNEIKSILPLISRDAPVVGPMSPTQVGTEPRNTIGQDVRVSTKTMDLLKVEAEVLRDLVYELMGRQ